MRIKIFHGDRVKLMALFALGDVSQAQISTYISCGEILAAWDGGTIIGHLQIIETGNPDAFEIKSMAVSEARQGEGVGRVLVQAAIAYCRARKGRRLIVSTAAAATGNLRFYQRQGFRMHRIVRDAFGPSTGYAEGTLVDGIPLRDQVFLDLEVHCPAE
jgi:GNAT superfamily N-acetyltransferase